MKWAVNLGVRPDDRSGVTLPWMFTVESKSVAMALEKAAQEARRLGWQTASVYSCNPAADPR